MSKRDKYQILLDEVKQKYASLVWTHKTQEKQAEIYDSLYNKIKFIDILFAALTSCGILAVLRDSNILDFKILTMLCSFISLFCSAYLGSFDLQRLSESNKSCANKLVICRDMLLHLITKIEIKIGTLESLNKEYESISKDISSIFELAPQTTNKALKLAKKSFDNNEYSYSNDEINKFIFNAIKSSNPEENK